MNEKYKLLRLNEEIMKWLVEKSDYELKGVGKICKKYGFKNRASIGAIRKYHILSLHALEKAIEEIEEGNL